MRIAKPIQHTGEFWNASSPEDRHFGTLTVSEGGSIELEITSLDQAFVPFDESNVDRIYGQVTRLGHVILEDCIFTHRALPFGIPANSRLHIHRAYIKCLPNDDAAKLFRSVVFELEGIDEWIGITGINVDFDRSLRTASISYKPIKKITESLSDNDTLSFRFGYSLPGSPHITEAKITQTVSIEICSKTEQKIEHFISIAHKLANLVCFATGQTTTIKNFRAEDSFGQPDDGDSPLLIDVYFQSLPFADSPIKVTRQDSVFIYPELEDRWGLILRNWYQAYEDLSPALGLYFSTQNGTHRYLESKFLSLAQCLETFSRRTDFDTQMESQEFSSLVDALMSACEEDHKEWLAGKLKYANEMNLRKRLIKLIQPFASKFGSGADRKTLINNIVSTRNYLTHYDESNKSAAITGRTLWITSMKMEALFEVCMLKLLGFSDSEIERKCETYTPIGRKLKAH